MSSTETPYETGRGFGLSSREARVIGGASALMAINVALMYVLVVTPLASVNEVPVLVPDHRCARLRRSHHGRTGSRRAWRHGRGHGNRVRRDGHSEIGLRGLPEPACFASRLESQLTILAVTAVVVALLTAVISAYVYARSKTFEHWGSYANYAFIGGIVAILIGSFVAPVLLVGFVLIFLGFLLRLGWEIWKVRDQRNASVALRRSASTSPSPASSFTSCKLVMRYFRIARVILIGFARAFPTVRSSEWKTEPECSTIVATRNRHTLPPDFCSRRAAPVQMVRDRRSR